MFVKSYCVSFSILSFGNNFEMQTINFAFPSTWFFSAEQVSIPLQARWDEFDTQRFLMQRSLWSLFLSFWFSELVGNLSLHSKALHSNNVGWLLQLDCIHCSFISIEKEFLHWGNLSSILKTPVSCCPLLLAIVKTNMRRHEITDFSEYILGLSWLSNFL